MRELVKGMGNITNSRAWRGMKRIAVIIGFVLLVLFGVIVANIFAGT